MQAAALIDRSVGRLHVSLSWQACRYLDAELQQRAVEYLGLEARPEVAKRNVAPMPPWEKRRSLLLRRMAAKEVCPCTGGLGSPCVRVVLFVGQLPMQSMHMDAAVVFLLLLSGRQLTQSHQSTLQSVDAASLPEWSSVADTRWMGVQDQTDEVQQQPGWLQDGEDDADGERAELPAVPLPGQPGSQPASAPAAEPAEDLLSLSETPRAGATANGGSPTGVQGPCALL